MAASFPLFPRSLTAAVQTALADTPVVCIAGARQSGKTTLVRGLDPSRPFYTLDEGRYHHTAQLDPDGFIAGLPEFVTIDEVQRVPDLLRAIKLSVDRNRRYGRFLLTGSANILTVPTVSESLAGRMEIVVLHPLTEAEKERRPGKVPGARCSPATSAPGIRQHQPIPFRLWNASSRAGIRNRSSALRSAPGSGTATIWTSFCSATSAK